MAKEFSISYANLTLSQYTSDLLTAQDIIIKVAQDHQFDKNEQHLHHEQYRSMTNFANIMNKNKMFQHHHPLRNLQSFQLTLMF